MTTGVVPTGVIPWICPQCGREVGCVNAGQPMELCAQCAEAREGETRVMLVQRYDPAVTLLQEIGALAELTYAELNPFADLTLAHDFLIIVKALLEIHVARGSVPGMEDRPEDVMQQARELWDGVKQQKKGAIRV